MTFVIAIIKERLQILQLINLNDGRMILQSKKVLKFADINSKDVESLWRQYAGEIGQGS